jgi:tetratricopeptide (TPR) repeat protein
MYDIIPLVLILVGLTTIIIIAVRKFSVLASLDIEAIKREREAKFKQQIISNRLKRVYSKYHDQALALLKPASVGVSGFFIGLHDRLIEYKLNYKKDKKINLDSEETVISRLFLDIEDHLRDDMIDLAEKKYIEIIGLDSQNLKAFQGLGDLYFEKKQYNEAKQTYRHVIKLLESNIDDYDLNINDGLKNRQFSDIYFDLSLIEKILENQESALEYINKALNIEPNNPRYLDTKFELCIMNKDKELARATFEKLKEVDPENGKLAELKKEIDEMEIV